MPRIVCYGIVYSSLLVVHSDRSMFGQRRCEQRRELPSADVSSGGSYLCDIGLPGYLVAVATAPDGTETGCDRRGLDWRPGAAPLRWRLLYKVG